MKQNTTNNIIEKLEYALLNESRGNYNSFLLLDIYDFRRVTKDFLHTLLQEQISYLKEMRKKTLLNMLQDDELFQDRGIDGVMGCNLAIDQQITHLRQVQEGLGSTANLKDEKIEANRRKIERCALCNTPFEQHHYKHEYNDKYYHTSCVEKLQESIISNDK